MKFGKLFPLSSTEDRDGSEAVAAPWKLKKQLVKIQRRMSSKEKNGWFRLVYLKDGEIVVFLCLVYKWFTLDDPPNFMSFTYFVGFIFWTNMFGFGIVFHWVDVFFVHNDWGKTSLDRNWQTPEFSKHLDDPPKTNISIHDCLTLEEGGCHLQPVCWLAVSSLPSRGLVRITSSLSSPSSWTFVYLELWRRTLVPLKQRFFMIPVDSWNPEV